MPRSFLVFHFRSRLAHRREKSALGVAIEQIGLYVYALSLLSGLLQDLPDSFERHRQRFKVFRLADRPQRVEPLARIHQIVSAGAKDCVHFVVAKAVLLAEHIARSVAQELQYLHLLLSRDGFLRRMRQQNLQPLADG